MADIAFEKDLSVAETGIEGLKVVDLAVHGDSRGWFKENWQRAKMCALGIPDLRVVQNNISYNDSRGVTRGIHAEPWDKFISVARGSGSDALDQLARDAVQGWKFRPATRGGEPVAQSIQVPVSFTLPPVRPDACFALDAGRAPAG